MSNYYKSGVWNIICEICGRKCKSDQVRKRWDGLIVCLDDFDIRHPLDFIRPYPPERSVPFVADEPADTYIYVCYIEYSQGIAGLGQAGCARAGIIVSPSILAHL